MTAGPPPLSNPVSSPTPSPASPAAPSLGGLRELVSFLVAAFALFLLVQFSALYFLVWEAAKTSSGQDWAELSREVSERHQADAFLIVPVQAVSYALLLLLLFILLRRRGLPFWSSLAVRRLSGGQMTTAFAAGVLLAILVQLANVLFPPPEPLAFDRLFSSRAAAQLIIAASLLLAPLVEEIVFRGYIFTLLERLWSTTPAVLASGLLFGSIHFPQLWPGVFQMFLLCVVGIVFSLARAQTGNTTAAIATHFGYNAAISVLFLLSPAFRALPT
jgi:membrane protease YdiL (CAAX protease family)